MNRMSFSDQMVRLVDNVNLMMDLIKKLNQVKISSRKLLDVVGDGDNGPPAHYSDAWYELSDALDLCDMEVSKANGQVDKPQQRGVDI